MHCIKSKFCWSFC